MATRFLTTIILLFCLNASAQVGPKVEIYLLNRTVTRNGLPSYFVAKATDLKAAVFIADSDIVSYDTANYQLVISESAAARIWELHPPLQTGQAFAVAVDRRPVFTGYFYSPFSSFSFHSYVVPAGKSTTLQFQKGLPESKGTAIPERRKDHMLLAALKKSGRLR